MTFPSQDLRKRSVTAVGFLAAVALSSQVSAELHVVTIENFRFHPEKLEIRAGDTVVWQNLDIVPHTATDIDKIWDTGEIQSGESVEVQFDTAISGDYFCFYHPNMLARLMIKE